jgi:hypothetical protein
LNVHRGEGAILGAPTLPNIREGIVTPFRACGHPAGSVAKAMLKISYDGYRFPPEIIQQAIWLYLRFTLSFRDVEDLLAERGVAVSYETVRRWVNHFGPMIAADLRKRRPEGGVTTPPRGVPPRRNFTTCRDERARRALFSGLDARRLETVRDRITFECTETVAQSA